MMHQMEFPNLLAGAMLPVMLYALGVLVYGIYALIKIPNYDARFYYAGFWMRVIAAVTDSIILAILALILGFFVGDFQEIGIAGADPLSDTDMIAPAIDAFISNVIGLIYYVVMESSKYQATLGKMLFGLQVVDIHGNRLSLARAAGRNFGKIISFVLLYFGFFMAGWTRQKQGLHDKMAGCLVVRRSPLMLQQTPRVTRP